MFLLYFPYLLVYLIRTFPHLIYQDFNLSMIEALSFNTSFVLWLRKQWSEPLLFFKY